MWEQENNNTGYHCLRNERVASYNLSVAVDPTTTEVARSSRTMSMVTFSTCGQGPKVPVEDVRAEKSGSKRPDGTTRSSSHSGCSTPMDKPSQPPLTLTRPPILSLITPSASPPVSRNLSRPPNHPPEQPSPAKRPRLTLTPSSSFSSSPFASSSAQPEDPSKIDFDAARHESTMRVLNVWSQLAERYSRRLDEDDIIDLRSGDIIKDRGVLRSAPSEYKFGYIMQGEDPVNDASSDAGALTEGEDELDELDAFAPEADISDELDAKLRGARRKELDPADEDDLAEFLEAEKRMREEGGPVDEDYEEEDAVGLREFLRENVEDTREDGEDEASGVGGTDWEDVSDSVDEAELSMPNPGKHPQSFAPGAATVIKSLPPRQRDPAPMPDSDSEDELGVWEMDESNAIYAISKPTPSSPVRELEPEDNDVIEIFDTPPPSPPPTDPEPPPEQAPPNISVLPALNGSQTKPQTPSRKLVAQTQLQTPPHSFASSCDETAPPISRPRPRPAYKGAKISAPFTTPAVIASPSPSTSTKENTPQSSQIIRHLDLTKVSKTPKKTPKKAPPRTSMIPEVVIVRKPRRKSVTSGTSTPDVSVTGSKLAKLPIPSPSDTPQSISKAKDKGKSKLALEPAKTPRPPKKLAHTPQAKPDKKGKGRSLDPGVIDLSSNEDDGPIPLPSTSSLPPSSPSSQLPPFSPLRSASPRPPTGRKRKRVSSLPKMSPISDSQAGPSRLAERSGESRQEKSFSRSSPVLSTRKANIAARSVSPDIPLADLLAKSQENERARSRSRARSHSRARSVPPSSSDNPIGTPLPEPYYMPRHSSRPPDHAHLSDRASHPSPFPPVNGQQAQYLLAQAMHHLSYLISASSGGPPVASGEQLAWPPMAPAMGGQYGQSFPPPYWAPPALPHHPYAQPERGSSPDASGSRARAPYRTPTHHSGSYYPPSTPGTLPPSSPEPEDLSGSSPPLRPCSRPRSMSRGRSKSRGRRVSFKLDDGPPVFARRDEDDLDWRSRQVWESSDYEVPLASSSPRTSPEPVTPKARGRSRSVRREVSPTAPGVQTNTIRGRGRTPGPAPGDERRR
ncbi:hypothetical protein EVG20_g4370 [Dentipellis fragilis]|uniref:Uncharacterized protein n=1 Tax=Dentipellis fragilis TaxID=205917 RepID=A0A4Y9YYN0_9AGAM|nr:hypothetical protein EVG20_g4370 [Dentipellis fragilis]